VIFPSDSALHNVRPIGEHVFVARVGGTHLIRERLAASPPLSSADGHFLAGLLDAEACFTIVPNNGMTTWRCEMALSMRLDEADLLIALGRSTGIGHVTAQRARGNSKPLATWHSSLPPPGRPAVAQIGPGSPTPQKRSSGRARTKLPGFPSPNPNAKISTSRRASMSCEPRQALIPVR
jgi:hypothetical protein